VAYAATKGRVSALIFDDSIRGFVVFFSLSIGELIDEYWRKLGSI